MSVISRLLKCDWPGCKKTLRQLPCRALNDFCWETRCCGVYHVCEVHKFKTSGELVGAQGRAERSQKKGACRQKRS